LITPRINTIVPKKGGIIQTRQFWEKKRGGPGAMKQRRKKRRRNGREKETIKRWRERQDGPSRNDGSQSGEDRTKN